MSITRKLSLLLCVLCATLVLNIFALGLVLVSGTQDVISDLEIHYTPSSGGISFVIGNDCNNPEDFAPIEVDKATQTAVVGQPANPDVLGKCFAGWYTDENLTNKIESWPVTLISGTKLYPSYYDATSSIVYAFDSTTNSYYVGNNSSTTETDIIIADIYNDGTNGIAKVTSIGDRAFSSCSGLTSITIPNSVTSIGDWAFASCSGLTSVTIGNSVTSIGDFAFNSCIGLTSIKVDSGNTKYDSRNNCNAIIEASTNTLIFGCKNTVIPNSVTSIGDYAFQYCSGLESITIPNSVTSIGYEAFFSCSGLTSVTIGNSVTSIGSDAFFACSSLTSITIPTSVTSIGYHAFNVCSKLTSVTFDNTTGWWVSTDGSATSGDSVTISATDLSANATLLTDTYCDKYWKRT